MKYGSKYVSLKEDDPYTVTLERALEVIRLKQEADANRIITDFGVDNIQVLNGRYGPYITDGKKNAKVPKEREPKSLTLEECRALLAQAPERGKGRCGPPWASRTAARPRPCPRHACRVSGRRWEPGAQAAHAGGNITYRRVRQPPPSGNRSRCRPAPREDGRPAHQRR